jgi:hypothetical protein
VIKFDKFLLILVVCIQTMFLAHAHARNPKYPNAEVSCDNVKAFVAKAAKKLEKKYNIDLCGIGSGVRDKVWLVNLSFNKYGLPLSEMEARKLIIAITQNFLDLINQEEKIRPYLENYPFTSKNVKIALFNYTENAGNHYHPWITSSSMSKGKTLFMSFDPGMIPLRLHDEIYETYEESLAIIAKEKQDQQNLWN